MGCAQSGGKRVVRGRRELKRTEGQAWSGQPAEDAQAPPKGRGT